MKHLKLSAALVTVVVLTGCATNPVEIDYIEPECTLPPLPTEPAPEWEELLIPFSWIDSGHADYREYDQALDKYEAYEAALVDSIGEHRAMLKAACADSEN